jgi:hypothetical protein
MYTTTVAVCIAIMVSQTSAGMSLTSCTQATNGKTEWHGAMQYKCAFSSDGNAVELINCRTPVARTVIAAGQDVRDGDFHYKCVGSQKSLAMHVDYCYLPGANGAALLVGESVKADGGVYSCVEVDDTQHGITSITRKFAKETLMCQVDGKDVHIGKTVTLNDKISVVYCYNSNGEAVIRATGCVLPDGGKVGLWQISNGFMCELMDGGKQTALIARDDVCKRDGKADQKVGSYFVEGAGATEGVYTCKYANMNAYRKDRTVVLFAEVIFNNCMVTIDGNKRTQMHQHRAKKANDGKYYWCKGTQGANGAFTFATEVMTDAESTCDSGIKIDQRRIEANNVQYGCQFYKGKLSLYVSRCYTDTTPSKAVSRNAKLDLGTYGWSCARIDGSYVSRRMTDEEYKAWKASLNTSVTATGGFGEGEEGYEPDTPTEPTCKDGYRLNADKTSCVDIDECEEESNDCDDNKRCHNTPGSNKCLCLIGQTRKANGTCSALPCPCFGNK